jgi:hypothetical protein
MPDSKSSALRRFLSFAFKFVGSIILLTAATILAKLNLAPKAEDWQATLQELPLWALFCLLIALPIVWLLLPIVRLIAEFIGIVFKGADKTSVLFNF